MDLNRKDRVLLDNKFWVVGNPDFAGHDRLGFRNIEDIDNCSILAIGDSWTYGMGLKTLQTWTNLYNNNNNNKIYNCAVGGWGLIEFYEALKKYKIGKNKVVFSIYLGNDIVAAYTHTYKAQNMYTQFLKDKFNVNEALEIPFSTKQLSQDILKIQNNFCCSYDEAILIASKDDNIDVTSISINSSYFLFTPYMRHTLVDINNEKVKMSLSISLHMLQKSFDLCQENGMEVVIQIFPTKENIFYTGYKDKINFLDVFEKIKVSEYFLTEKLIELCIENNIKYKDYLDCLSKNPDAYFLEKSIDGHPNYKASKLISEELPKLLV